VKTIPRNHAKRITELKATLHTCRVFTLENYFHGKDADPVHAWAALERYQGKLTDHEDGRYTIHIHSNCWYELRA
jgi:hypothetical protein